MWVAKSIHSLSETEKESWHQVELQLPLSQTITWARAIESVSGKTFVVFNPNEEVGGIVFTKSDALDENFLHFECVNGPFLLWDDPQVAARQLATFALAVSKTDRRFKSLSIKPRWESGYFPQRLKGLPVSIFSRSQASTLIIPVYSKQETQFLSLSPRMRRTLSLAWRNEIDTKWEPVTLKLLAEFVPNLTQFAKHRGFSVPPLRWFEALIEENAPFAGSPKFWLASSCKKKDGSQQALAQLLICFRGLRAHYLFGYDIRRPGLPSSISTSAAAHWRVLIQCAAGGIQEYDLNGYMTEIEQSHPYYGVCRFKKQFTGNIINYDVPEFFIEV